MFFNFISILAAAEEIVGGYVENFAQAAKLLVTALIHALFEPLINGLGDAHLVGDLLLGHFALQPQFAQPFSHFVFYHRSPPRILQIS